jgi:D-3-phosphoglycerate dehydrogenase
VLDLLDWISRRPRTYAETLEAWHTHCPRLPVWEDALAAGLVEVRRNRGGAGSLVAVTPAGAAALGAMRT